MAEMLGCERPTFGGGLGSLEGLRMPINPWGALKSWSITASRLTRDNQPNSGNLSRRLRCHCCRAVVIRQICCPPRSSGRMQSCMSGFGLRGTSHGLLGSIRAGNKPSTSKQSKHRPHLRFINCAARKMKSRSLLGDLKGDTAAQTGRFDVRITAQRNAAANLRTGPPLCSLHPLPARHGSEYAAARA